jgi:hypothetical protein
MESQLAELERRLRAEAAEVERKLRAELAEIERRLRADLRHSRYLDKKKRKNEDEGQPSTNRRGCQPRRAMP